VIEMQPRIRWKKKCVWWREGRRVVIRFEYFIYGPEEKDHGARKVRRKLS
jgi:hypothetical protein